MPSVPEGTTLYKFVSVWAYLINGSSSVNGRSLI
jgi:hypothetical protein